MAAGIKTSRFQYGGRGISWGRATRFSQSWTYFRQKNVMIFHTRFQTWPQRNLCHHLNLDLKRSSLEKIIPDSSPKWAKSKPVFKQKRRTNHTLWGGTYLHGLYMGVLPRDCNTAPACPHSFRAINHAYALPLWVYQPLDEGPCISDASCSYTEKFRELAIHQRTTF